ncbi:MAG: hypothetical protein ACYSTT_16210 [Planctomycetota bacterium]|jgi:hypothetical protein
MNADIMIEQVEPAQCRTLQAEELIKRDRLAQQRAAWECLKFFENTPATEADFRMKFASMADDDVTLLKAFYNVKTDDELLAMICCFWNARIYQAASL